MMITEHGMEIELIILLSTETVVLTCNDLTQETKIKILILYKQFFQFNPFCDLFHGENVSQGQPMELDAPWPTISNLQTIFEFYFSFLCCCLFRHQYHWQPFGESAIIKDKTLMIKQEINTKECNLAYKLLLYLHVSDSITCK